MTSPPPRTLTRDAVIAQAMRTVAASGMEALSVRGLAGDLGVTPMAIYWHVKDKNEILDGVVEATLASIRTDDLDDATRPPVDDLRVLAERYRAAFAAHPGSARVLALRQGLAAQGPAAARLVALASRLLRATGLGEKETLSALLVLVQFLMGAVVMEHGTPDRGAGPAVTAPADGAVVPSADERFAFGLRLLLDGIQVAADRDRTG